ncbi:MAG: ABC transporter ATP-binding protein [Gemmatimonadaceae bacterium]|nr:ABC transporter ATP-binding protein [Gemmatimonadaceae bacterium]MBA3655772.1 ABC transporter ATP-binding protein [Gemmatimonadaceae bacterium]
MIIGMILEMAGVGLVIPLLVLLSRGDIATQYPFTAPFLRALGNPDPERLIVYGMAILVAVTGIKVVFLAFLAWVQARFVFGLQADLSQRLFAGYLRQPYTFHLQRNTAQLIRNTMSQASGATAVFSSSLVLTTEVLVLFGITILLMIFEPLGSILVVTTLGAAGSAFSRYTKRHLLRWGDAAQLHEGMRIQHLQQGLGGAKDVKLLGREDDFLAQYRFHNDGSARIGWIHATLSALPRLWLELLAAIGLATLVLVMVWQRKPASAFLPVLGLFTAAAFRLMPSVNRVLTSSQQIRFWSPVVDSLASEFQLLSGAVPPRSSPPLPFKHQLSLEGIGFTYPGSEGEVLSDVSIAIESGTSVGFIGGSGAGKSTLVDIILGLLPPQHGAVRVDGVDIASNLRGWQDQIGYVPQSIYLTDDTLRRNVAFGLPEGQIDDEAVHRALGAAQLTEFIADLPEGVETRVGERGIRLSGGQQQRIGIARALYHDPPVLVLDEATSSLDGATERGVIAAVRALEGSKTILIVAHRISTVEHCSHLFRLEHGRIVEKGETSRVLGALAARGG